MMLGILKSGLNRFQKAFAKTRSLLAGKMADIFSRPLSEETLETLEELLFEADLGSKLTTYIVDQVRLFAKKNPKAKTSDYMGAIKDLSKSILEKPPTVEGKRPSQGQPKVILIVGVNGSGKTTSAGKLAKQCLLQKKSILLAAGDTFRAAATEQLGVLAKRLKIDCVKGKAGGDPSAVIFDALTAAQARKTDVVIADTAGRLHSKTDLMEELSKIKRVCQKIVPNSPHETYLVLDATTGQNAIDQAKIFHSFTPLTGLIITKLDGSAKGGIVLSIYREMGIPIKYIGIGEGLDDLEPFEINPFISALFDQKN